MADLPKVGHTYRIWKVVEDLILDRYEQIRQERMRDSWYLLREWLEPLRGSRINDDEFDYFAENYEYYRDGLWPRLEKNHGIRRPETKPPTVVIDRGEEHTEAHIHDAWPRARGFIFVEKSGMASDLTPLSRWGWLIVAAQGESTRSFREKAANDDTNRPILAVTDADYYGGGIAETLKGHSERTEHLGLWRELESRVQSIGLTREDGTAMDLPRERDPTKSPDEWRIELNALTVLRERRGVENPLLAYVVAKMDGLGIPICPLPYTDLEAQVRYDLRSALEEAMSGAVARVARRVVSDMDVKEDIPAEGSGEEHVQLRYREGRDGNLDLSDLEEEMVDVAEGRRDRLLWWHQSAYEDNKPFSVVAGVDDVRRMLS